MAGLLGLPEVNVTVESSRGYMGVTQNRAHVLLYLHVLSLWDVWGVTDSD